MEDPSWWDAERRGGMRFEQYDEPEELARLLQDRAVLEAQPVVPLEDLGPLEPPEPGLVILALAVDSTGDLVALWCADADRSVFVLSRPMPRSPRDWPGSRAARSASVVVSRHRPGCATRVLARIAALEVTYPLVQPMPDGTVLIVGAVSELTSTGPQRNAVRFDRDGAVVGRATIGDGVEHLQTTASGDTWVGYADSGIFGNHGWGEQGRPGGEIEPIGTWGLIRFDDSLTPVWEFGRAEFEAGVRDRMTIDHVYALNVVDETAWAFVYSDWAIVRVEANAIDAWDTDVQGAGVLLVGDDRQALVGGYGPAFDRIVVGHVEPGRFVRDATMRLVQRDGSGLPPATRFLGRGSVLHAVVADRWLRWSL